MIWEEILVKQPWKSSIIYKGIFLSRFITNIPIFNIEYVLSSVEFFDDSSLKDFTDVFSKRVISFVIFSFFLPILCSICYKYLLSELLGVFSQKIKNQPSVYVVFFRMNSWKLSKKDDLLVWSTVPKESLQVLNIVLPLYISKTCMRSSGWLRLIFGTKILLQIYLVISEYLNLLGFSQLSKAVLDGKGYYPVMTSYRMHPTVNKSEE